MNKLFKTTVGAAILTGAVYTAVKNKETLKNKLPKKSEDTNDIKVKKDSEK